MTPSLKGVASRKRLLNAFGSDSWERIYPHIERVEAKLGDVLCEAGSVCNPRIFPR
jgi:hypothetical protein